MRIISRTRAKFRFPTGFLLLRLFIASFLERAAVEQDLLERAPGVGALLPDVEPDTRLHEKEEYAVPDDAVEPKARIMIE